MHLTRLTRSAAETRLPACLPAVCLFPIYLYIASAAESWMRIYVPACMHPISIQRRQAPPGVSVPLITLYLRKQFLKIFTESAFGYFAVLCSTICSLDIVTNTTTHIGILFQIKLLSCEKRLQSLCSERIVFQ